VGYPLNNLLAAGVTVSSGAVSALAGINNDSRFLQLSAPVQPGGGGGPVLDHGGHLVGMVSGKLDALAIARVVGDIPQNVNFAVKQSVIETFLDAHGVAYERAEARSPLATADVADVAKKFTVLVECWR